jgi:hypothetical protein
VRWLVILVLICISLMIHDFKYFFIAPLCMELENIM